MNICVFCSSSDKLPQDYYSAAAALGIWIGKNGHSLVYGGSQKGLMKVCAEAVKQAGGRVISVAPGFVLDNGMLNPSSDEVLRVEDLAERKRTMMQLSDIFVALPGGIGTLDEVFSMAACNVVGECSKKIILLNHKGIYNDLKTLLQKLEDTALINSRKNGNLHFCNNLEDCFAIINNTKQK